LVKEHQPSTSSGLEKLGNQVELQHQHAKQKFYLATSLRYSETVFVDSGACRDEKSATKSLKQNNTMSAKREQCNAQHMIAN